MRRFQFNSRNIATERKVIAVVAFRVRDTSVNTGEPDACQYDGRIHRSVDD